MNGLKIINSKILIFFIVILIISARAGIPPGVAETDTASLLTQGKLKLGLALSGGGAKGIAHIPILEELEKRKIPVYCIAGTSIGSIVGGLSAMGYSSGQIKNIFFNMDWIHALSDDLSRKERAMYMKPSYDRYLFALNFDAHSVSLPSGLIWGYNIQKVLARYTIPAGQYSSFSEFPIPFSCVATDLETGDKKVFRHGDLGDAIRASMSIPSVFTPWIVENRHYLDGGLVANNPVDEAFAMGADIVLAVDISAPLKELADLNNLISIMDQSMSFSMSKLSKEALKKATFVIRPDISPFGTLDFGDVQAIYDSGAVAVSQNDSIFDSLQKKTRDITYQTPPGISLPEKVTIRQLQILGSDLDEKALFFQLDLNKNQTVSLAKIETVIDRLYGNGFYEQVYYRLKKIENDDYILVLHLKPAQDNIIAFSHEYTSHDNLQVLFSVVMDNVLFNNDLFFADIKASSTPAVNLGMMKWLPAFNRTIGGITGSYEETISKIYDYKTAIASYNKKERSVKLFLAHFIKNTAMIQLKGGLEARNTAPAVGDPSLPTQKKSYLTGSLRVTIDQLDDYYFPTVGYFLNSEFKYIEEKLRLGYLASGIFDWRLYGRINKNHIFFTRLQSGTVFDAPETSGSYFFLGGFDSFYGFKTSQVATPHFNMLTAGYRYRINNFFFIQPEAQMVTTRDNKIFWEPGTTETEYSGNLSFQVKLPVTQMSLTFSRSTYYDFLMWFRLGYDLKFPL